MAEEVFYVPCQGSGCHEHCILTTYVEDGRIVRTERTVFDEPEGEWGGICQKGLAAGKLPYSDTRVMYPMKRVGERGEGKFEKISWEQALDEIAAKIKEIGDKYGTRAVGVYNFPCGMVPVFGLYFPLSVRFAATYGATFLGMPSVDTAGFFPTFFDFGSAWDYFVQDRRPMANSKYILLWGVQPMSTRPTWSTRLILDAQEKGAKVVYIGLEYTAAAAKADEFIHINGGTDAALALAMVNEVLKNKLYDEEFIARYSVMPFLVREDNGKFLRESDITEGGDPENYVIWNKVPAKPVAVPPHTFEYEKGIWPDIDAEVIINGIPCKTAFLKIKEVAAEYTPEAQEAITGVSADTVRQLVKDLAEIKPASIWYDFGFGRYTNGQRPGRAIDLLAVLLNNITDCGLVIGSGIGYCWPVNLNSLEIMFPDGDPSQSKASYLTPSQWISAATTGEPYPLRAILMVGGNSVHNMPNRKDWEDALKALDLVVSYEIRLTDSALWADYVLPDHTVFEKYDLISPAEYNHLILEQPCIPPVADGKPPEVLYYELAKRLGLEQYFNKTVEEWINLWLKTDDPAISGINPPPTFEELKKKKRVRLNVPGDKYYSPFNSLEFKTPSGRVEVYAEDLADIGEAVARYVDPYIKGPDAKEFPLQLYTARSRFFMQTQFWDIKELRLLSGLEPSLRLNPAEAAKRGIKDGDLVQVFNRKGSMKLKAKLSEAIPPGVVHVWYGWRQQDYLEGNYSYLLNSHMRNEFDDPLRQRWAQVAMERYPFPPEANLEFAITTNWDIYWDNLCEVRKV